MQNRFDLLILPAPGTLDALWHSLEKQTETSFGLFVPWSLGMPPTDARCHRLDLRDGAGAGELLQQFFTASQAPLLGLLPTTTTLVPHALARIDRLLCTRGDVGWAFTDYELLEGDTQRLMELLEDKGDITEREDRGPCVWIVRDALNAVGGIRNGLKYAPLYDLRLRFGEKYQALHIAEPLVRQSLDAPVMTEEEKQKAAKLYFPGQGKLGGFSYLFMGQEEEAEIESVFYDTLKRRGAWLEGEDGIIECPPDEPQSGGEPKVSVVIPVYNRAKFIGSAIESVQSGTYLDFEIIVVDNASTDDTVKVVEKLMEKDKRIRLLKRKTNVIGEALNDGLFAAKGRYLAQLDSDDAYAENTLERAVAALDGDRKAGVAISYYDLVDEQGVPMPEFGVITHSQYNRNNILRRDGAGAARIWRKSFLMANGGFDEVSFGSYGEDYDMILKCGERHRILRLKEVLYHYRRHPDNTDVLRHHSLKIWSKTESRKRAIIRRKRINELLKTGA